MEKNFGVGYAISAAHAIRIFSIFRRRRVVETFDGPTLIAHKMRVVVFGRAVLRSISISPYLVISPDAMYQILFGKRLQGSIKGHVVSSLGQLFKDLRGAQRLARAGEDRQYAGPHRGPAQAGFMKQIGGFSVSFVHNAIIAFAYLRCLRRNYRTSEIRENFRKKSVLASGVIFRAGRVLPPK